MSADVIRAGMQDPYSGLANYYMKPGAPPTQISNAPFANPGTPQPIPPSSVTVPAMQTARPGKSSNETIPYSRVSCHQEAWMDRPLARPGDVLWLDAGSHSRTMGNGIQIRPGQVGQDVSQTYDVRAVQDINAMLQEAPFKIGGTKLLFDVRQCCWNAPRYEDDGRGNVKIDANEKKVVERPEFNNLQGPFDKDGDLPRLCQLLGRWKPDGVVMSNEVSMEMAGAMGKTHQLYNVAISGLARVNNGARRDMVTGTPLQVFDEETVPLDTLYMALVVHTIDRQKETDEQTRLEKSNTDFKDKLTTLGQERGRLVNALAEANNKVNECVETLKTAESTGSTTSAAYTKAQKDLAKWYQTKVSPKQSAFMRAEQAMELNEQTIHTETDKMQKAAERMKAWTDKNDAIKAEAESDMNAAADLLRQAKTNRSTLKEKLEKARQEFNEVRNKYDNNAAELKYMEADVPLAQQKVKDAAQVVEQTKNQVRNVKGMITSKDRDIEACNASISLTTTRIAELKQIIKFDGYLKYECITARRLYIAQRLVDKKRVRLSKRAKPNPDPAKDEDVRIYKNAIGMWRIGTVSDSRASAATGSGVESHALAVTAFVDIRWQRMYDLRAKFGAELGGDVVEHYANPDDWNRGELYGSGICDDTGFDGGSIGLEALLRLQKKWDKSLKNSLQGRGDGLPPECNRVVEQVREAEVRQQTTAQATVNIFDLIDEDANGDITMKEFNDALLGDEGVYSIFSDAFNPTGKKLTHEEFKNFDKEDRERAVAELFKTMGSGQQAVRIVQFLRFVQSKIKNALEYNLISFDALPGGGLLNRSTIATYAANACLMHTAGAQTGASAKEKANLCDRLFEAMPAHTATPISGQWGSSLVDQGTMQTLVSGKPKFSYEEAERNKTGWMAKMIRANRIAHAAPKNPWVHSATNVPPVPVDAGVCWLVEAAEGIIEASRGTLQLAVTVDTSNNTVAAVDAFRTAHAQVGAFLSKAQATQAKLAEVGAHMKAFAKSQASPSEVKATVDALTDVTRMLEETRSEGRGVVDRVWKSVRAAPLRVKWPGVLAKPMAPPVAIAPAPMDVDAGASSGAGSSTDEDDFSIVGRPNVSALSSSSDDMGVGPIRPAPKSRSRSATPQKRNLQRKS